MKKNTKRGFTIVELVIVIAVIAILAGVLIPTFSSLIKRANISADTSAVKNINTALVISSVNTDMDDFGNVLSSIQLAGYEIDSLIPQTKGFTIAYDKTSESFALIDTISGDVVFPESNNTEWYQILITEASLCASANYHPTYFVYRNTVFEDLEIKYAKGLDIGGNTIKATNLEISDFAENNFILSNGYADITNYTVTDTQGHFVHDGTATVYASTTTMNVSNASYVLDGVLATETIQIQNDTNLKVNTFEATCALNITGNDTPITFSGTGAKITPYTAVNTAGTEITANTENLTTTINTAVAKSIKVGDLVQADLATALETLNTSGGTLSIPAGVYDLGGTAKSITKESVTIMGAGKYSTIIKGAAFIIENNNITIQDLTLENINATRKVVITLQDSACAGGTLSVENATNKYANDFTLKNVKVYFDANGLYGMHGGAGDVLNAMAENPIKNLIIDGCEFVTAATSGVKMLAFSHLESCTIRNSTFDNNFAPLNRTTIGDIVYDHSQNAIEFNQKAGAIKNYTIENCEFNGFGIADAFNGAINLKARGRFDGTNTITNSGDNENYKGYFAANGIMTVTGCRFYNCYRDIVLGEGNSDVTKQTARIDASHYSITNCFSDHGNVRVIDRYYNQTDISINN